MEDHAVQADRDGKKNLTDYKFFCFNGEPKLLYISTGMENHATAKISFYDLDGKLSEIKRQLGQKAAGTAEA